MCATRPAALAVSGGSGGERGGRWAGAATCTGLGGAGRPAGRALLPFPPLLCNRALGSIKNSALQADCNAPSLGSTVWSGINARRSVAFQLQHRQRLGGGHAVGRPEPHDPLQPAAAGPCRALRRCHRATPAPQPGPGLAGAPTLPPGRGLSSCAGLGAGTRLPEPPSRLGPAPRATFGQKQKQTKGILEGRETPRLEAEVALLYLYFSPPLFSF